MSDDLLQQVMQSRSMILPRQSWPTESHRDGLWWRRPLCWVTTQEWTGISVRGRQGA